MRFLGYLVFALTTAIALNNGAALANTCQAENLTCPTTMPVGGYCECTSRGATQGGTVVERPAPRTRQNSTAGGCGAHPNEPGCR